MYNLLIRLMLLSALAQLGLSLSDLANCHSRQGMKKIERASREILHIDWKPISVWPEWQSGLDKKFYFLLKVGKNIFNYGPVSTTC